MPRGRPTIRVRRLRARQRRNFLATLMLSQGVPMLSHGDEFGRSQGGNNNAYCQDNELSWVRWPERGRGAGAGEPDDADGPDEAADAEELALLAFVRQMVWLRRDHPVFRRRRFFQGHPAEGAHDELSDIAWFTAGGEEMGPRDWQSVHAKALTVFLNGSSISEPGPRGEPVTDDSFLLMFNAHDQEKEFSVPEHLGRQWQVVVDTDRPQAVADGGGAKVKAGDRLTLIGRSLLVLQRPA